MATAWGDMLKRGCDIAWVLRVEGITTLFTERAIRRSDSASAVTLPSGYAAACPALLVSDGDSVSVELDRKEGVARGDAWEIVLAWNALEDSGILDDLFARPSVGSNLAAVPDGGSDSVLEYNGTTIVVDDTTGLSNGQTVWLGKEAITIGAVDGDGVSLSRSATTARSRTGPRCGVAASSNSTRISCRARGGSSTTPGSPAPITRRSGAAT